MLLLAAGLPFDTQQSDFFAAESLPAAHGRNVVNGIIVDFRVLDTLGEIAVVALALVAALPLLQRAREELMGSRALLAEVFQRVLHPALLLASL